jgi:hypothetical protein
LCAAQRVDERPDRDIVSLFSAVLLGEPAKDSASERMNAAAELVL